MIRLLTQLHFFMEAMGKYTPPTWAIALIFSFITVAVSFFTRRLLRYFGKGINGKNVKVVFILGGPGSGKSTQSANIVKHFGYTHLSAGDLLQAEIVSGSKNGTLIQKFRKEGKIVPSEITIRLLLKAMQESKNDKFIIDGFPRNEENRAAFESRMNIVPEFVLFLECSKEEMTKRLLNRNQGRVDDNIKTILERFEVFEESTLPVIEHYSKMRKVHKLDAAKPAEDLFNDIKRVFSLHRVTAT